MKNEEHSSGNSPYLLGMCEAVKLRKVLNNWNNRWTTASTVSSAYQGYSLMTLLTTNMLVFKHWKRFHGSRSYESFLILPTMLTLPRINKMVNVMKAQEEWIKNVAKTYCTILQYSSWTPQMNVEIIVETSLLPTSEVQFHMATNFVKRM